MKTNYLLVALLSILMFTVSCSKNGAEPQIVFTNNIAEGQANSAGEYTITGHMDSEEQLDYVTLTKQGEANPFLIDESTAKNKTQYDFSYLITGITANTTIVIKIYDQEGQAVTANFLIRK